MSVCHACGTEIPEGARFCQNCGAEVAGVVGPGAIPTPPGPGAAHSSPTAAWNPPALSVAPYTYPPPPYPIVPGQSIVPSRNGKAVAGMWLGIVSIPAMILTWVGIIIGVLGLVFSLIALKETRGQEESGTGTSARQDRRKAVAGAICSVVGIVASSALFVYILMHLEQFGIHLTR